MEWVLLLAAAAALTATEALAVAGPIALPALLLWLVLRLLGRRRGPRPPALAPVLVLLASGAVAAAISYAPAAAWMEYARVVLTASLYVQLATGAGRERAVAGHALAALGAALALYWPWQYDFARLAPKFPGLAGAGARMRALLPALPGPAVDANIAAGALALTLPVSIALAVRWRREGRRGAARPLAAAVLVQGAALVLTGSRGAWLAVLCALVVSWAWRLFAEPAVAGAPSRGRRAIAAAVMVALLGAGLVASLPGAIEDSGGVRQSRLELWRQGAALGRAAPFTGTGFATFPLVHSTYALLLHVPTQNHVHDTYLQVWLDQGLLGVAGLVWLGVAVAGWAVRARAGATPLAVGALAALVAAAAHGLFDVALYGARTLPLLGVVAGIASVAAADRPLRAGREPRRRRWLVAVAGLAVVALAAVGWRRLTAAACWNAGALAQTRFELAAYDPRRFDDPSLDAIRARPGLDAAVRWHRRALASQPRAATPLERLAQIELARGRYAPACDLARRAARSAPRDPVARLTLADCLVAEADPAAAAEALAGLSWAAPRLHGQAWYRYWLAGDFRRAAAAWDARLRLEPDNVEAARWRAEAEARARRP